MSNGGGKNIKIDNLLLEGLIVIYGGNFFFILFFGIRLGTPSGFRSLLGYDTTIDCGDFIAAIEAEGGMVTCVRGMKNLKRRNESGCFYCRRGGGIAAAWGPFLFPCGTTTSSRVGFVYSGWSEPPRSSLFFFLLFLHLGQHESKDDALPRSQCYGLNVVRAPLCYVCVCVCVCVLCVVLPNTFYWSFRLRGSGLWESATAIFAMCICMRHALVDFVLCWAVCGARQLHLKAWNSAGRVHSSAASCLHIRERGVSLWVSLWARAREPEVQIEPGFFYRELWTIQWRCVSIYSVRRLYGIHGFVFCFSINFLSCKNFVDFPSVLCCFLDDTDRWIDWEFWGLFVSMHVRTVFCVILLLDQSFPSGMTGSNWSVTSSVSINLWLTLVL